MSERRLFYTLTRPCVPPAELPRPLAGSRSRYVPFLSTNVYLRNVSASASHRVEPRPRAPHPTRNPPVPRPYVPLPPSYRAHLLTLNVSYHPPTLRLEIRSFQNRQKSRFHWCFGYMSCMKVRPSLLTTLERLCILYNTYQGHPRTHSRSTGVRRCCRNAE